MYTISIIEVEYSLCFVLVCWHTQYISLELRIVQDFLIQERNSKIIFSNHMPMLSLLILLFKILKLEWVSFEKFSCANYWIEFYHMST